MHDPQIVAHEIKSPFKRKDHWFPEGYRDTLITIWHVDPEKDGTDDSCGWFMRARHGDKEILKKIIKRFEYDWDRVFTSDSTGVIYNCGFFKKDGNPHLSVQSIGLNLFYLASLEVFPNREKAIKFMKKNLFEIMLFVENPFDSMYDSITRKFEIGCNETHTEKVRKERIENIASCIYGWILRESRPWYKHPKWHIHHWKIQWHFFQKLNRWLFARCSKCGKRFTKWGDSNVVGNWSGDEIWHGKCDDSSKTINK